MKTTKKIKPQRKDLAWQQNINKVLIKENVKLGHPKGKDRFKRVINSVINKPSK